jgi:hypothetical protein
MENLAMRDPPRLQISFLGLKLNADGALAVIVAFLIVLALVIGQRL